MNNTKNNHFVPQGYLKNFLNDKLSLYKYDLNNSLKSYEITNLKKECSCKNLYSTKQKITYEEIRFTCKLAGYNDEVEIDFCKKICDYINGDFSSFIDNTYPIHIPLEYHKMFMTYIKGILDEKSISRSQENIFTSVYENDFYNILDKIIKSESIDFLNNNVNSSSVSLYLYVKLEAFLHKSAFKIINKKLKEVYPNLPNTKEIEENLGKLKFNTNLYVDLIHYLIIQYFRTEKQIDNLKNSLIHLKKYWESQYADYQLPDYVQKFIGLNEDSFIFIHLKSIYLVESLINSQYKLLLLNNDTEVPFITSDSPCINIYASYIDPFELQGNDFEIYFPISPTLALLYTNRTGYKNIENTEITLNNKKMILQFNASIKKLAKRYLYSNINSLLML
ncbi:TPA: hypothetical protein CPT82_02510 [Candidatus Gastranaerophilales bacterium HUM_2]|nr:MAG TPA: hypothetical protein CPT82_02510 [Candidatus Gastranaerophilales bacterium HUM_2]